MNITVERGADKNVLRATMTTIFETTYYYSGAAGVWRSGVDGSLVHSEFAYILEAEKAKMLEAEEERDRLMIVSDLKLRFNGIRDFGGPV
jgi:hypothetical protein